MLRNQFCDNSDFMLRIKVRCWFITNSISKKNGSQKNRISSDITWRSKIIHTLHSWNLRGRLLSCISSFLTDRSFHVCIGDTISSPHLLENGVPQGAVRSPLLFNIAINDITSAISPLVRVTLFADDLALFLPCSSPLWIVWRTNTPRKPELT